MTRRAYEEPIPVRQDALQFVVAGGKAQGYEGNGVDNGDQNGDEPNPAQGSEGTGLHGSRPCLAGVCAASRPESLF